MNIRKILDSDMVACAVILESGYNQTPYNEVFKEGTALRYIQGKFAYCKDSSFVAIDDRGAIVGFVLVALSTWSDGPQAVIEEIVVSPNYQYTGIGTLLLRQAHEYIISTGSTSAMLWVKNNEKLLHFYTKHGYTVADDYVVMFRDF